ncbi:xanthine phosphoribosyltransferase [Catenisphaera adipataccumulans]|jgi:xanthine phosphoribosyltransferase|uniref:Xanthine phosphoribosyltransferase n=1 Tax=Catenisphaera adipataccumulans TaxID=700500 RepID=A0A7W8CY41_9FIRM|nr:xanthine phosphoribosyltransferase [Catenisphaera adipataccumulans]MBB5182583.1 xanthine phosphoribosyltransferase [Catenisphaera adipataccumulans]
MEKLKQAIETHGKCVSDEVVKVDQIINHQVDCALMDEIGQAFYDYFKAKPIDKVVTIESSGIAPAYACALRLGVPLLIIKKAQPNTMSDPLFAKVFSFTKRKAYSICVEREYLKPGEHLLFIDDFLANGEAFKGAEELARQAGAVIDGVGIVIGKQFQNGQAYLDKHGYDVYTLAPIKEIKDQHIIWAE